MSFCSLVGKFAAPLRSACSLRIMSASLVPPNAIVEARWGSIFANAATGSEAANAGITIRIARQISDGVSVRRTKDLGFNVMVGWAGVRRTRLQGLVVIGHL